MIMTAEAQIKDYLELLSSKAPVPGGGGASALAGALGDSLGQMVVHLTLGKKRYAQAEQDMLNYERELDRKSTRLNSSHSGESRMPSSA